MSELEGEKAVRRSGSLKAPFVAVASVAVLAAVTAAGFLAGSSSVSLGDLLAWATGGDVSAAAKSILVNVRLPRVLAALLAGGALAVAGAIIQAVLDNPLASPNIIGINSGAGLFVLVAASVFPQVLWLPPLAAFLGALVTALVIFGISLGANTSRLTVVLAGIAITTVFGAGMNTILIVNPDAYIGSSTFLVGGLAGVLMDDLLWPAVYIAAGLAAALFAAGKLNIMALGDDTAHALGMNVGACRLAMLGLAAVLAGAAVSFAGLLGFAGLIIPHLVRFFVGHDNRMVLPLSAVAGAAFVVVCDLLARVLFAPYEVPVGILMAFLGGPFFIYLILKNRRGSLE
ncbi:FecCD family ABC transporter permease [Gordonibacter massiliensis (ex Traore et al. 2017)]|uniref:FecCD family ABC transporter permease n=1 Tax=Gordonibacter massiliensis (ex Traore et al. 2017) TaxID=1841863 RepID=UPI0034A08CF0